MSADAVLEPPLSALPSKARVFELTVCAGTQIQGRARLSRSCWINRAPGGADEDVRLCTGPACSRSGVGKCIFAHGDAQPSRGTTQRGRDDNAEGVVHATLVRQDLRTNSAAAGVRHGPAPRFRDGRQLVRILAPSRR